eukprot:3003891-Pyramimonas_sp.AAC.1
MCIRDRGRHARLAPDHLGRLAQDLAVTDWRLGTDVEPKMRSAIKPLAAMTCSLAKLRGSESQPRAPVTTPPRWP